MFGVAEIAVNWAGAFVKALLDLSEVFRSVWDISLFVLFLLGLVCLLASLHSVLCFLPLTSDFYVLITVSL